LVKPAIQPKDVTPATDRGGFKQEAPNTDVRGAGTLNDGTFSRGFSDAQTGGNTDSHAKQNSRQSGVAREFGNDNNVQADGQPRVHLAPVDTRGAVMNGMREQSVEQTVGAGPRVFRVVMEKFVPQTTAIVSHLAEHAESTAKLILTPESLGTIVVNMRIPGTTKFYSSGSSQCRNERSG
jgi:hypothetical protein